MLISATWKYRARMMLLGSAAALALVACGDDGQGTMPEAGESGQMADQNVAETQDVSAAEDASAEFLDLTERQAAAYLTANPELATSLGVEEEIAGADYNTRFGDYGYAGNEAAKAMNDRFLDDLAMVDRAELTGTAAVTYDVLRNAYTMAAARNAYSFGNNQVMGSSGPYVMNQLIGPHIGLPQLLLNEQPLGAPGDVDAYLARLEAMGPALTATADRLNGDASSGVIPPLFALEKIVVTIDSFIEPAPSENPLVAGFGGKLADIEGLDAGAREEAMSEAAQIVEATVYPAYRDLRDTVLSLYDQASPDAGIWVLDEGADFYQHALDSFGADGMSAEEIHQLGLDEVERVEAEMDTILTELGLTDGTVGDRFTAMSENYDAVYPNTDEGKAELLEVLTAQVDAVMAISPDWFGTLPPQDLEVRRIPVYEQDSAPGGYYTGPSLDGTRPGIYWINLKDTADWPKHTLKTLTYHEAVPGHHFQIALQMDIDNFPLIRNTFFYSEYSEGWALYAEKVAAEMGMYEDDPRGDLGRLQSELFRAVRLVVDTGLHHKQWTREEAIDYMVEKLGGTRAPHTREVERYAVWPGQATSYKLGMIKIGELRARAEEALGEDFDIRRFHDEILLDGALPLPLLEARIDRWIESASAG